MTDASRYLFRFIQSARCASRTGLMARGTQPCPLQIGQDQHHDGLRRNPGQTPGTERQAGAKHQTAQPSVCSPGIGCQEPPDRSACAAGWRRAIRLPQAAERSLLPQERRQPRQIGQWPLQGQLQRRPWRRRRPHRPTSQDAETGEKQRGTWKTPVLRASSGGRPCAGRWGP